MSNYFRFISPPKRTNERRLEEQANTQTGDEDEDLLLRIAALFVQHDHETCAESADEEACPDDRAVALEYREEDTARHRHETAAKREGDHPDTTHRCVRAKDLEVNRQIIRLAEKDESVDEDGDHDHRSRTSLEETRRENCDARGVEFPHDGANDENTTNDKENDGLGIAPARLAEVESDEEQCNARHEQSEAEEVKLRDMLTDGLGRAGVEFQEEEKRCCKTSGCGGVSGSTTRPHKVTGTNSASLPRNTTSTKLEKRN